MSGKITVYVVNDTPVATHVSDKPLPPGLKVGKEYVRIDGRYYEVTFEQTVTLKRGYTETGGEKHE